MPRLPSLLLEQIEGNLAQDSQILGAMVVTDSAVVFSEGDIEPQCRLFSMLQWLRVAESNVLACPARLLM